MPAPTAYAEGIARLEKQIDGGFKTMNEKLDSLEVRVRSIETGEAGCRGIQELHIANLQREQGEQEKRLDEVEKWIPAVKALVWIGGILGVSVVGLIWSLITGAVQLMVK